MKWKMKVEVPAGDFLRCVYRLLIGFPIRRTMSWGNRVGNRENVFVLCRLCRVQVVFGWSRCLSEKGKLTRRRRISCWNESVDFFLKFGEMQLLAYHISLARANDCEML